MPLFIQKSDYFLSQRKPPTEYLQRQGGILFWPPVPPEKKITQKKPGTAPDDDTHTASGPKKGRKSSNLQQKSSPSNAPRKTEAAATAKFREGEPNASESHLRLAVAARNRSRCLTPGGLGTASRSLARGKQARERMLRFSLKISCFAGFEIGGSGEIPGRTVLPICDNYCK